MVKIKENIHIFLKKFIFKMSPTNRQYFLISKNACLFIGLQNMAKKWSDDGDEIAATDLVSDSIKYLNNFTLYCNIKNIDPITHIKMYEE